MATTTQFKLKITGILLFFYPVIAFSQSLSGVVTDSLTREPVGYASVSLYGTAQSDKPVTGTISDSTGFFRLEKISGGDYILRINCMGYDRKEIPISITRRDNIDLKSIELKLDENVLDEVTVTGEQRTITLKPDKKIIAIDDAMASSGESLAEILRILPEIRVTDDERITLRNQSVSVYINGKPATMSLFQIPVSEVEKVEVMTNPSVKYRPDGLGGIINVITKKRMAGINGVVQAAARTDNIYGGTFMLNYGTEKFNLFTTIFPKYFNTNIDGYSNTVTHGVGASEENMNSNTSSFVEGFKLGFDLDITKNDLLTVYWSQMYIDGNVTNKVVSTFNRLNPPETSTINTNSNSEYSINRNALLLNYKHLFKKKGTEFYFDIMHNFPENSKSPLEYGTTDENGLQITAPYRLFPEYVDRSSNIKSNFTTILSQKINLNMDIGVDVSLNKNHENYSGATLVNGSWRDSASIRNSFGIDECTPSAYLLFEFKIKKFEFNTGARLEYYRLKSGRDVMQNNISNYYLYPNFAVSYSANDYNGFNISYNRRINRPAMYNLNPINHNTDYVNEKHIGNENLQPSFSNSFVFGYSFYKNNFGINASLSYMDIKDVIENTFYNIGDIRYKTYGNTADQQITTADLGINWKYKVISFYLAGGVHNETYSKKMQNPIETSNYWSYDIRFFPQLRLKNNYFFNLQTVYNGTSYHAYYKYTESFHVSLHASKTIKNLTFSLRAINIVNKINRRIAWSENYTNELFFDNNDTALFQVGILYKFGDEKRRIRARTDLNRNPIQLSR
jgi:hypothetical protein